MVPEHWISGCDRDRNSAGYRNGNTETDRGGTVQDSKSVIAAHSLLSPKNQEEDGKKYSIFQGMNISPERRAEIRAGLQRDFDQIFDEVDPAVYERDPAAGVA